MYLVMMLIVAVLIAYAVVNKLGGSADEQNTAASQTAEQSLPQVPTSPALYKNFEQNLERFSEDAAQQKKDRIDQQTQ
jgi:hypothetical protein